MIVRAAKPHASRVMPWDSSSVFLAKSLLYPVAATASLGVALLVCHAPFEHAYFLIAVIAFLATADFLGAAPLQQVNAGPMRLGGLLNISVQWSIVVAFIWVL